VNYSELPIKKQRNHMKLTIDYFFIWKLLEFKKSINQKIKRGSIKWRMSAIEGWEMREENLKVKVNRQRYKYILWIDFKKRERREEEDQNINF